MTAAALREAHFCAKPAGITSANYTHIFGPATIFHFLFARSYIDLTLRSKGDDANESDLAPQLFSESFACGFVGGYGGNKLLHPVYSNTGYCRRE